MIKIVSTMIEAHLFRIRRNRIEFLLLKRSEDEIYPLLWQMVSGSIHKGETAVQTALREIKEETDLVPQKFWVVPNINSFYSLEKNHISVLPVFAGKISSSSRVKLSNEHTEYIWTTKEKAKKLLAWAGQRRSVDIISEYFTKQKSCLNLIEVKF